MPFLLLQPDDLIQSHQQERQGQVDKQEANETERGVRRRRVETRQVDAETEEAARGQRPPRSTPGPASPTRVGSKPAASDARQ